MRRLSLADPSTVADPNLSRYSDSTSDRRSAARMKGNPISIRPTPAQMQWLRQQREERGIPISSLVNLALELAMEAHKSKARAGTASKAKKS